MEMFKLIISTTGYAIETVGVVIIVIGIWRAARVAYGALSTEDRDVVFHRFRHEFAQTTLVGMDFLVAGDIIRTVIVSHSLPQLTYLADRIAVLSDKPTRVRAVVDVDLPRPRSADPAAQLQRADSLIREYFAD